jgi:hypothetical protein
MSHVRWQSLCSVGSFGSVGMTAVHAAETNSIYFMAISAQDKLLIDRYQYLWARKYVLHAGDLGGEPGAP